jgi:NIMA (never in mitosis gene a)-related kinase 1/4/5
MENYEKLKYLGHGSNGNKVYLVKHLMTGSIYAMKTMNIVGDPQKYISEAKILCSLNHDNIIKYIDSFFDTETVYIVMEYAEGGDLNQYIRQCKENNSYIAEIQVWKWLIQLILAVKYIHTKKVLHRDIKVHNAFLNSKAEIKLGDFGIAKVLENTIDYTYSTLGTPFYLSPEICEGVKYNLKTDIWMLGCLGYELCSLQRPYTGESIPAILHCIKTQDSPIISNKKYSKELVSLVNKMMDKNQDTRPSIDQLLSSNIVVAKMKELNMNDEKPHTYFLSRSFGEKKYLKINIKDNNTEKERDLSNMRLQNNCGIMHREVKDSMNEFNKVSELYKHIYQNPFLLA